METMTTMGGWTVTAILMLAGIGLGMFVVPALWVKMAPAKAPESVVMASATLMPAMAESNQFWNLATSCVVAACVVYGFLPTMGNWFAGIDAALYIALLFLMKPYRKDPGEVAQS